MTQTHETSSATTTDAERLRSLATQPVGRLLWQYSLPAVVGMLVVSAYNIVDRIFIGHGVGPEAIAGMAVSLPLMNLSGALGVLIGGGASARVSILLGAGDIERARQVLGNALTLTLIIGITYAALFYIFLDPILMAFGATEVTLPYAREMMLYLIPGFPIINLALSFNNIMRASGYPTRAMVTNIIGALVNVPLNALFIFGFGMGIKGASIATVIAMSTCCVFVMAHFLRRDSTLRFSRGIYGLRASVVWGIIAIGAAPSLINAAASLINAIINTSLVRYGGDMAVAAAGIFTTLSTLGVMVMAGISQGMQPIVGYNYGAGQRHRSHSAFWLAVGAASVVSAVCSLTGLSIPRLWARCFTTSPELIDLTANAFHWGFWAFATVGIQVVATTFFQAIGKAGQSIFLSLSRQVIFLIPLLLILPLHLGLNGVWMAFPLGDLCATVAALLLIWHQWHSKRD